MNEEALSCRNYDPSTHSFKSVFFNSLYNAASFLSLTQIVLSIISVLRFLISCTILSREKD